MKINIVGLGTRKPLAVRLEAVPRVGDTMLFRGGGELVEGPVERTVEQVVWDCTNPVLTSVSIVLAPAK